MTNEIDGIEKKGINKMSEYPKVKLSDLIEMILKLKVIAINPNQSLCRDKLYNRLTHLEHTLVMLKDVNVELERDWWEE